MKSGTRLDSAVFQLTPTRTRCDLIITANGKVEKMASGLLNPFLAHLRTAQDQIAKGGYSIVLEPETGSDATWFTKGTVERFVRFVSTPEVLERVYTIESEILQIKEAIAIQSNNDIGLSTAEDHQKKPVESLQVAKPMLEANEEKAIVLYKPGVHQAEANRSTANEGDSKVQLLRVLETRKTVLQNEQGMAFARAVAAGFDIDHIAPLISFAELFGASRLMDACLRFVDLWKRKHETGQWLEIEAADAMSSPPDFSSMDASGIMFANVTNKQKELSEGRPESSTDLGPENNEKASVNAGDKCPIDHCVPFGNQEYMQGRFPHPMFPPWPIHSPPGAVPIYQAYPMQGIPYYQNYPGNDPYFQPPYQSVEDPRGNGGQTMGQRRNSMDGRDSNTESETWDQTASKIRSQDDLETDKQISQSREPRKKASHSGKKCSSTVVIRNINYITSKEQNSSVSESQSDSDSETYGDGELQDADAQLKSKRSSKRRGSRTKSVDTSDSYDKEDTFHEKEADSGQWKTFQNYLMRDADEDKRVIDHGMLALEKDVQVKRRQVRDGDDLVVLGGQNPGEMQEERISDFQSISGNVVHMPKASNDEMFLSRREGHSGNGRESIDGQIQFSEIEGKRSVYRRTATDDFLIHGQENQSELTGSSDPLAVNGIERTTNNMDRGLSHTMADESFIVPSRSGLLGQHGTDYRDAIDIYSELPSPLQKAEDLSNRAGSHVIYQPDDLSLMPERGAEKSSVGYDPAFDYEMQGHADDAAAMVNKNKEVTDVKCLSNKLDRGQRSKVDPNASDKKKLLGAKKGKPSKLSPLDEARARAERLRSFKADLQKVKKEKEEEALKRLEALKMERQKRIAARSGSIPASSSPLPSQLTRKQLPTKHSPVPHKGSKFSDSEPGSLSPLKRAPKKNFSLGSSNSPITTKPSSLNNGSRSAGNRLIQSVSSLPVPNKENESITPDQKASMARIRRLSEPKKSSSHHVPSVKLRSTDTVSKPKPYDGPARKNISAIINLDKTKAATLPELKIRTPKGPSDGIQSIPEATEMTQQVNGIISSTTCEVSNLNGENDHILDHNEMDDKPVIEKTVVMLECEKPSAPTAHASDEITVLLKGHYDNHNPGEKNEVLPEYAPIHAPVSQFNVDGVDREPINRQLVKQSNSYEVSTAYKEEESPKLSGTSNAEKPYQAPFARVSSIEDPCTGNSEYGKAPPCVEMSTARTDTAKALVSDFKNLKLQEIPEASEKSQVKESSKGFRRLLKLGRKNHSSAAGDRLSESNNVIVTGSDVGDNVTNTGTSSEVHTLKNLISQDETPSGSTTQKSSRPFSLLSPLARIAKRS